MEKKIEFKDLSGWLKAAVIISWIVGTYAIIAFAIGFIIGMTAEI